MPLPEEKKNEDFDEEENSEFESAFEEFAGSNTSADDDPNELADDDDPAGEEGEGKAGEDNKGNGKGEGPEPDEKDKELELLRHQVRSQNGRISGLNKSLEQTRQELQVFHKQPPKKAAAGEKSGEESGEEETEVDKWKRLADEFPELAEAVETRLTSINSQWEKTSSALNQVVEQVTPVLTERQKATIEKEYNLLETKHEDWEDIVFGDSRKSYVDWLQEQPLAVQGLVKSQDARDAIFLLDAFKASGRYGETGQGDDDGLSDVERIQQKRQQTLKKSGGLRGRKVGHMAAAGGKGGSFEDAFAYFAKQKEKKLAKQRVF